MTVPYTITPITGDVFHVRCQTQEDLAYLFLRSQEHYESRNIEFYRQNFKIDAFKKWYCRCFTGEDTFTYPYDWCGFNVPGAIALSATKGAFKIGDNNKYDHEMLEIIQHCQKKSKRFYLIGTMDEVSDLQTLSSALAHELAHAFYYLDAEYRNIMNQLTAPILQRMQVVLYLNGYHPSVIRDEAQAYLVDGIEFLAMKEDYSSFEVEARRVFMQKFKNLVLITRSEEKDVYSG
jgi:hypothetical protein